MIVGVSSETICFSSLSSRAKATEVWSYVFALHQQHNEVALERDPTGFIEN